jgi:type VI secretion system secreted protein VgrG
MNKKSGTAGTPVEPTAPVAPHEADKADPGEVEKVKADQRKTQTGKYGSVKVKPFTPASEDGGGADGASEEKSEEKKLSWIEIELVGEDDKPIPGEKYSITLPDNSVAEGTLDDKGFARVEGFEKGDCKVTFPELDAAAWEFIESKGALNPP